ncbi:MAG: CcoQ/FixQ family Cbb3-type cytochrome c oxidase assembly chaperone [Hyphomicrobiales bacterium]|nr:MAG: CcoQ/FixQ family Cbb3-type cytochrome c oxidase assembly chaperone [Hyphomicrobiales bacterium]
MDYDVFRQFADSWGLAYLTAVFVIVVLFVFRPGSKKIYDELSKIPLKDDEHVK